MDDAKHYPRNGEVSATDRARAPERWFFPLPKPYDEMSEAERDEFADELFMRLKAALLGRS
jgi:hypothetical protein